MINAMTFLDRRAFNRGRAEAVARSVRAAGGSSASASSAAGGDRRTAFFETRGRASAKLIGPTAAVTAFDQASHYWAQNSDSVMADGSVDEADEDLQLMADLDGIDDDSGDEDADESGGDEADDDEGDEVDEDDDDEADDDEA